MARKPFAGQPEGAGESPPAGMPENEQPAADNEQPAVDVENEQPAVDVGATHEAAEQVSEDLDELTETKRERDEYLELAKRTRADFDNYRKRVTKEAADALQRGRAELARDLIPVVDNLERALAAGQQAPDSEALAKGVALVHQELRSALERAGVEAYDPAGEPFDPAWHEAISTRAAEETKPGIVLETLERGYRLNGQVLRPARVVVSE